MAYCTGFLSRYFAPRASNHSLIALDSVRWDNLSLACTRRRLARGRRPVYQLEHRDPTEVRDPRGVLHASAGVVVARVYSPTRRRAGARASTASRTPAAPCFAGAARRLRWRATSSSRSRRASCVTSAARRRGRGVLLISKTGTSLGHHAARTESAGSAVAAPPANATTRFVNWRAAAASRR